MSAFQGKVINYIICKSSIIYGLIASQVLPLSTCWQSQPFSLTVGSCFFLAGIAVCAAMWKNGAGNWSSWKTSSQKGLCFSVWYIFCHTSSCAGMARGCQSEQGSEGLEVEWHLLELTEQPCLQILNCALKDVLSCLLSLVFGISLNRQGKVQKRGKNFIHFVHA